MIHDAVERQPPLVPDTTNGSDFGLIKLQTIKPVFFPLIPISPIPI